MPPLSRLAARRDHLVVCGDDALAARVIEELTTTYGEEVTVLLRSREQNQGPHIARLPKVRIIERADLDADAFTAAGVQSARSLALLRQDDLGNFHAALRAQELNPDLRLVVAVFNTSLGERIRTFFRDCAVLSGSSMSAPSFVAAALGELAPSHIRVAGRTLFVARRTAIQSRRVVCGLAMTEDPLSPACSRRTRPALTWCSPWRTAHPATRSPGRAVTRCARPPTWPGTCCGTRWGSPSARCSPSWSPGS